MGGSFAIRRETSGLWITIPPGGGNGQERSTSRKRKRRIILLCPSLTLPARRCWRPCFVLTISGNASLLLGRGGPGRLPTTTLPPCEEPSMLDLVTGTSTDCRG